MRQILQRNEGDWAINKFEVLIRINNVIEETVDKLMTWLLPAKLVTVLKHARQFGNAENLPV